MALTGNRAILPQRPAIACECGISRSRRGEREGEADRHGRGERRGAMKKYTPQRIVNPR